MIYSNYSCQERLKGKSHPLNLLILHRPTISWRRRIPHLRLRRQHSCPERQKDRSLLPNLLILPPMIRRHQKIMGLRLQRQHSCQERLKSRLCLPNLLPLRRLMISRRRRILHLRRQRQCRRADSNRYQMVRLPLSQLSLIHRNIRSCNNLKGANRRAIRYKKYICLVSSVCMM